MLCFPGMDRRTELLAAIKLLDKTLKGPIGGEFGLSGSEVTALLREKRITLSEIATLGEERAGSVTDEVKERRDQAAAEALAAAAKSS